MIGAVQISLFVNLCFEDPAAFEGSGGEKLAKFRQIRDQIEMTVKDWLEEQAK